MFYHDLRSQPFLKGAKMTSGKHQFAAGCSSSWINVQSFGDPKLDLAQRRHYRGALSSKCGTNDTKEGDFL